MFRTLPDSILSDPKVNELNANAEVLFRRLWSVVDDHGIYLADPEKIASACWPTTHTDSVIILQSIIELKRLSLIRQYPVNGVEYIYIVDWRSKWKQGGRSKTSKYPMPSESQDYAIVYPVKGGLTWGLTRDAMETLIATYKHKQVRYELNEALQWLKKNIPQHKTAQQMPAFLKGWIIRSRPGKESAPASGPNISNDMKRRIAKLCKTPPTTT